MHSLINLLIVVDILHYRNSNFDNSNAKIAYCLFRVSSLLKNLRYVLFFAGQLQGQGIAYYFLWLQVNFHLDIRRDNVSQVNIQSLIIKRCITFLPLSMLVTTKSLNFKELALKLYRFQKDLIHNGLNCNGSVFD
jgi:hypothetical protein